MTNTIAVLGAGTMGQGIAQVAALAGFRTTLFDIDAAALDRARGKIQAMVAKGIEKGKLDPNAQDQLAERLSTADDLPTAVQGADVVIEAVFEDLDLKARLFSEVAEVVGETCVLASNTSSLPITKIAERVPGPERVIGMHFFNPVPIMALVEVVRPVSTSEATVDSTMALARSFGKEPILVRDTPGFATSRLGVVIGLEAIRMLEAEVASAEEIDKAMELGYRHPMGPLRLTDLVGLDVRLAIAEHLHGELGEQFRPPELLRSLVKEGKLGKKSGQGFYTWA